ncbi:COX15/CtaA family protein [Vallicoccus soli]|uniref:COX15/CtaA family protein n=1 Tax=Vallicoccus soli TaxID=2339232 RepID=UPI001C49A163|nr:COX15/CtaA family protein [Vallicoccus soli]
MTRTSRLAPLGASAVVRRLAVANLVAQVGIVVTGAAVRLTGSGLGCSTWPRCVDESWTPTPEYGVHGAIEFGNRLLTYVLAAVALATLVAAWQHRPVRRDWRRLALLSFLGIPAQAVIGGITVLTQLNPWTVGLHFLASSVLVAVSTLLVRRTRDGGGPARPLVPRPMLLLGRAQLGVLGAVVVLGTVVTGSGPHAGDADVPRNGLDPAAVTQLHADAVFLLVGLTAATLVALQALGAPAAARRAWAWVLGVQLGQGAIGFVQYATDLPVALVAAHMLGSALLVVATVRAQDSLSGRGAVPGPAPLDLDAPDPLERPLTVPRAR